MTDLSPDTFLANTVPQPTRNLLLPEVPATIDVLNDVFPQAPYPFILQNDLAVKAAGGYEFFIAKNQQVPTRANNWHDYYNALCWHLFPLTKQALHLSQIRFQKPDAANKRSAEQNGATLFDENGVVVISSEQWVFEYLIQHRWHALFWQKREQLLKCCRIFVLGHAMWEKARQPYIGMTGKWIGIQAPADVVLADVSKGLHFADQELSRHMPLTPASMHPLPLLGWPGICQANRQESFYANTDYFRPKRRAGPELGPT